MSETLNQTYRKLILELPERFVKEAMDKDRFVQVGKYIANGLEAFKKENAKVADDGTVDLSYSQRLFSLTGGGTRYKDIQPWQFAIGRGIRSNLGLFMFLLASDLNKYMNYGLTGVRLDEYFAVALALYGSGAPLEDTIHPHTLLAKLVVNSILGLYTNSTNLGRAFSVEGAVQRESEKEQFTKMGLRIARQTRKTEVDVINRIKAQAVELYSKHPTWSHTKLAEVIKAKDEHDDLPGKSQIRQLIATHCPKIPKQKGGRRPAAKKN